MADSPGLFTLFNPLSITGCKLWLKADSLVLNDGDAVSTWTDSSGTGSNATASTTARPTYKTNIQYGLPIVRFDGVANIMSIASGLPTAQPDTMIFCGKQTSKSTPARYFDNGNGVTGRQLFGLAGGAGAAATGFLETFAGTVVRDAIDHSGTFHVLSCVFNGASSFGYVDGVLTIGPSNMGANAGVSSGKIGGDATTVFMTGDICEMFIYNSGLSAPDRQSVETYLKSKWGTP